MTRAELSRQITRMNAVRGLSLAAIASELREKGVPHPFGRRWTRIEVLDLRYRSELKKERDRPGPQPGAETNTDGEPGAPLDPAVELFREELAKRRMGGS